MASALQQLCKSTVNITEEKHDDFIRQSEQLRILKNFARNEKIFMTELLTLLDAMKEEEEEEKKNDE